ncbi:hypothetical protein RND71_030935 [Anisodus tanguticus]|uniref:Uncharacterized protein n=1 Tax=Anisodus tanguticus TaxID=243964 RepID=A0AAE1V1G6_9SOLA|nr:hypothetical protein RND71_030935 [Anisodus tanguticus]
MALVRLVKVCAVLPGKGEVRTQILKLCSSSVWRRPYFLLQFTTRNKLLLLVIFLEFLILEIFTCMDYILQLIFVWSFESIVHPKSYPEMKAENNL